MITIDNYRRISERRHRMLPGVSIAVQMTVIVRGANTFPVSLRAFDGLFFSVKERVLR